MNSRKYNLIVSLVVLFLAIFAADVFAAQSYYKPGGEYGEFSFELFFCFLLFVLFFVALAIKDIKHKIPIGFVVLHKIEFLTSAVLSVIVLHFILKYNVVGVESPQHPFSFLIFLFLMFVFYGAFSLANVRFFGFASPGIMYQWRVDQEKEG